MLHLLQSFITFFFLLLPFCLAQDYTCSSTKPCWIGCCGKNNVCGLGPDYCSAANCQGQCDQKSECNPGWGMQWSQRDKCPLNVCCSKYGFCGTTTDFCGNQTVKSPSCSGTSSNQRTIGYYEGWNTARTCDQMYPEDLPIGSYTHLNFAFAFIDPVTFAVAPMDDSQVSLYQRLTNLKNRNPGMQVWISIGGWSMNDPDQPTKTTFSDLAASTAAQSKFFASLISFMSTYGFDGVDIDWEYPVASERSGRPADYANFPTFLANLRNAFQSSGHNYGLTITIPSSYWYLQHFDIIKIAPIIDWFNLMSYDLHGTWDSTNPYIGSVIGAHTNLTEIDQALQLMWRNQIDPAKVVLGLGYYGRSFTLSNPTCTTAGCPFSGGAPAGECTGNVGMLSFPEINRLIAKGAKVTLDTKAAVKNVVYDTNKWVSYDDAQTFKMKIDYANGKCLGGTMVWAASLDDKNGTAAGVLGGVTGRKALSLNNIGQSSDPITTCVFSECGDGTNCPAGTRPAAIIDHAGQSAAIGLKEGNVACYDQTINGKSAVRTYCCPPDNMPTCKWGGKRKAPFCSPGCGDDEVEVATGVQGNGAECWTGHKSLCCKKKTSNQDLAKCKWEHSAPFCGSAGCDETDRKPLVSTSWGSGGEQPCVTGSKSYCCTQPAPFTGCAWNKYGDDDSWFHNPFVCAGKCPPGKQLVATDLGSCFYGQQVYCCDSQSPANNPTVSSFRSKLQDFANNPTCDVDGKKRASSSGWTLANDLSPIIAGARSRTTGIDLALSDTFDSVYGNTNNIHFQSIVDYQELLPGFDASRLSFDALCRGSRFDAGLRSLRGAESGVCELFPNTSRRRRALNTFRDRENGIYDVAVLANGSDIAKRNFWSDDEDINNSIPGRPSTGYIMYQIANGALDLAYIAVDRLGQNQDAHLLIEIAFDIRNRPTFQETPDDVLAVFHLHVDNLGFESGDTFLGVQFASVYHAQQVYTQRGQRSRGVNWNTGGNNNILNTNERAAVVECPRTDHLNRWWVGGRQVGESHRVNTFGRALVARGIITNALLQGMFDPATYQSDRHGRYFDTWGFNDNSNAARDRFSRSMLPDGNGGFSRNFDGSGYPQFQRGPPSNPPNGGGDPIKRIKKRISGWMEVALSSFRLLRV